MEKSQSKDLVFGFILLISFSGILFLLFTPVINEQNPMNYLDNLYNSISKGSVYYIPGLKSEADSYKGKNIQFKVALKNDEQADQTITILEKAGATTSALGNVVSVDGDLGSLLSESLDDSDFMFNNQGSAVNSKYGFNERQALYNWWIIMNQLNKSLTKEKRFAEAKFVGTVTNKAVECSYNYFGIVPVSITQNAFIVILSLVFYVVYTLWFGFAIMYIFKGIGLKLEH